MAEAILNTTAQKNGIDITASSAGIFAVQGDPPSAGAVTALAEIGISLIHTAKKVSERLYEENDVIIPVTKDHGKYLIQTGCPKEKIFILPEEIPDPYGGGIKEYRKCRDSIMRMCIKIISSLG